MADVIGKPVPPNLETMSIPALHALMESFDAEHQAIRAKELAVKPTLDAKHLMKSIAARAGHDQVIGGDGSGIARSLKEIMAKVYNSPQATLDAVKAFLEGGK